ncbi:MAG: glycoside hydrolase family 88 protein [Sulfuricurvum sp.]|nr:glycoside hydrolase family 88 protein [Sulfuricurvum sp.]
MKIKLSAIFVFAFIISCSATQLNKKDVKIQMKKVADWQILHFEESVNRESSFKGSYAMWSWTQGAMYVGMVQWAKLSGEDKYWDFLKGVGTKLQWKPGNRTFNGDDICVSRMYLELFDKYKQKEMIQPTITRLDSIIAFRPNVPLDISVKGNNARWSWADAIFMAPPVFFKLSKLSANAKYKKFAQQELCATYDTLYVKSDSLFLRDTSYKNKREKNGKRVFWARGNGWVVGGLLSIISNLPNKDPNKAKYIQLFKEMTSKIATLQGKDGFWAASLLDAGAYPVPESSSTGFMTYALAWGINQGYLDRKVYTPIAIKGWNALVSAVEKDGKLGWAQSIGASPGATKRGNSEVYAVGSFLCAGSEVYKLAK